MSDTEVADVLENESSHDTVSSEPEPPKTLESLITALSLNDRSRLCDELNYINRNGHIYHHQWPALKISHPKLLDTSFDILRKFESNGFQLHGIGCWFFERVVVSVGLGIDGSMKQSPVQILEMLLRVLLEHPCYHRCVMVFHSLCAATPELFETICDIGYRIFEELPVPIHSDNFCALFMFVMSVLRSRARSRAVADSETEQAYASLSMSCCLQALRMLALISTRVAASLLTEYHLERALDVCHHLYSELQQQEEQPQQKEAEEEEEARDFHSGQGVIFLFLRNCLPLHHSHAATVARSGFLVQAADHAIQLSRLPASSSALTRSGGDSGSFEDRGSSESSSAISSVRLAVQLIEGTVRCCDVVHCGTSPLDLIPQLTLAHVVTLLTAHRGVYIRDAVCLFLCTFAHFVAGPSSEKYDSHVTQFLHVFFEQALGMVQPPNTSGAQGTASSTDLKNVWMSVRMLGSDVSVLDVMHRGEFAEQRGKFIALTEAVLVSADESGFDMHHGGLVVDAMSVVGGWVDVCWRDTLLVDEQAQGILEATSVKFLKKRGRDSASSEGGGEGGEDEDEPMSRIRSSLSTLDLVTSPVRDSSSSSSSPQRSMSLSTSLAEMTTVLESGEDLFAGAIDDLDQKERDSEEGEGEAEVNEASEVEALVAAVARRGGRQCTGGTISPEDVQDFLQEWEVEDTATVCYKVVKLLGISRNHPLGLFSLPGLDLGGLAEVLVELLLDDRHGLSDEEGMREKCIQLLTDIIPLSDTVGAVVSEQVDLIIDILSDWGNFSDTFLMQSCLSALISMAKFSTASRRILDNLDKVKVVWHHVNSPIFTLAVLELCCAVMPSFKKANYGQEVLMFDWIMHCMAFHTKQMLIRTCHLILLISQANGPFVCKALSRCEVESYLLHVIKTSDDKKSVLVALRSLTIIASNFNSAPFWVHNRWLSLTSHCTQLLSGRRRELCSPEFMTTLLHLQYKFEEPFNLVILAYSLDIISSIRCLPWTLFGDTTDADNYSTKFFTVYMPLVAGLLAMITRAHNFCDVPEDMDDFVVLVPMSSSSNSLLAPSPHTSSSSSGSAAGNDTIMVHVSTTNRTIPDTMAAPPSAVPAGARTGSGSGSKHASGQPKTTGRISGDNAPPPPPPPGPGPSAPAPAPSPGLYCSLMSMSLEQINPVYDLLAASVVNALHSLITCLHLDALGNEAITLETFFSYSGLFANTPICESIVFIMIQLPHNCVAQVKGIIALEALLSRGLGARLLSECCTRVLTSAIISFVEDCGVHQAFCSIVTILSGRDSATRARLVAAGVHKWLYVVMKSATCVTGALSCRAIFNLVNCSIENSLVVGESGIVRPILLLLEKYPDNVSVQFEGLQLIAALCKHSKAVFRAVRESSGGEAGVTAARRVLTEALRGVPVASSEGGGGASKKRGSLMTLSRMIGGKSKGAASGQDSPKSNTPRNSTSSGIDVDTAAGGISGGAEVSNVDDTQQQCEGATATAPLEQQRQRVDQHEEQQNRPSTPVKGQSSSSAGSGSTKVPYSAQDIKDLLETSTPAKLSQQKCAIM